MVFIFKTIYSKIIEKKRIKESKKEAMFMIKQGFMNREKNVIHAIEKEPIIFDSVVDHLIGNGYEVKLLRGEIPGSKYKIVEVSEV